MKNILFQKSANIHYLQNGALVMALTLLPEIVSYSSKGNDNSPTNNNNNSGSGGLKLDTAVNKTGTSNDATIMNILLSYEQTFIDDVRTTGGRNYYRNLIIQGPNADINNTSTLMTTTPTDVVSNRMIAEIHYYTPWQFCGLTADASWGNMLYFWGSYAKQPNIDGVTRNTTWGNENYILAEFAKIKSQFIDKSIPVIMGEYGTMRRTMEKADEQTAHDNSIAEFLEDVTKNAKNAGITPFVWDTGSLIFDRNVLKIKYSLFLQAIMNGAKVGTYPF